MKGFEFELCCLTCGSECEVVNSGRVILGREVTAIVRCSECRVEYSVHIDMRPVANRSGNFMRMEGDGRTTSIEREKVPA